MLSLTEQSKFTLTPPFEELLNVRESVEFSLEILKVFGAEEHWPSRLSLEDLRKSFPDRNDAEIVYHLRCCIQTGLMDGIADPRRTISGPVENYNVYIQGLTHMGNEFLSNAESSGFFKKALELCQKKGIQITTNNVSLALEGLIRQTLS